MNEQVFMRLAEHGVLGILLLLACFVIARLYDELSKSQKGRTDEVEAVQKARIEDAKQTNDKLIQIVDRVVTGITLSTDASRATKEALLELRDTLDQKLSSKK